MPLDKADAFQSRLLALDLLRALAVFLVILRHSGEGSKAFGFLYRGGWVGVDLFFVLSGFLVSGLLFREYLQHGSIKVGRFLIRRGLKIYPAFYAFLLVSLLIPFNGTFTIAKTRLLGEIVFIQNYLGGLWNHTWSLAVEEHFYIGVSLLVSLLLASPIRKPLQLIPWICSLLMLGCLLLRLAMSDGNCSYMKNVFPTHLRVDSLAFGVLLSYCYHFHPSWQLKLRPYRYAYALIGIACIAPAFVFTLEENPFIYTYGFSLFYFGSGLLMMSLLLSTVPNRDGLRIIGYIGTHSYSIYLWHMAVIVWLIPGIGRFFDVWFSRTGMIIAAVALSFGVGILTARVLEIPVLRIRDRIFPSRSSRMA